MRATTGDICARLDDAVNKYSCSTLLEEASARLKELEAERHHMREVSKLHCEMIGSLYKEMDILEEELRYARAE